ncbi:hypothetical protein GCM10022295_85490 [Streptomyces osmaniensis]|uniref:Uncharacterized protein n=1 Tax=Streptomyces osmaniensis TaxID=593134 RepID=A0ABP6YVI7_9ACTN
MRALPGHEPDPTFGAGALPEMGPHWGQDQEPSGPCCAVPPQFGHCIVFAPWCVVGTVQDARAGRGAVGGGRGKAVSGSCTTMAAPWNMDYDGGMPAGPYSGGNTGHPSTRA